MRAPSRPPVVYLQVILIVVALGLLELAPRAGWVSTLTLVPLSEMVTQLWAMFVSGQIWPHLASTGSMVLIAFFLAVTTGIISGLMLWLSPRSFRMLDPYLTSYYALPIFAFYPVLIAIFGLNRIPIVLIAWAWAVVAVIVNTVAGLRHIPATYHKLVRAYRLSRWQALRRVYIPSAAPFIFNGVKLAFSYSIIGVIASEFILASKGLGWLVAYNYNNFGLTKMYATMLLIIILTGIATTIIGLIEKRIGKGHKSL